MLATHECIAATLYADLADLGLAVGSDVSVVCTFPVLDTRGLVPALSHFDADLEAVGVALGERLVARTPGPTGEAPFGSQLFPLQFAARASHGPRAAAGHGVTQAPLRADDRTQASTKATPATPSSMVG